MKQIDNKKSKTFYGMYAKLAVVLWVVAAMLTAAIILGVFVENNYLFLLMLLAPLVFVTIGIIFFIDRIYIDAENIRIAFLKKKQTHKIIDLKEIYIDIDRAGLASISKLVLCFEKTPDIARKSIFSYIQYCKENQVSFCVVGYNKKLLLLIKHSFQGTYIQHGQSVEGKRLEKFLKN
ncbi:MAG: hypothetical protein FWH03_03360 [Firmicutes bacterium]|nr:hypothetical protein [Bacillota bacterium]